MHRGKLRAIYRVCKAYARLSVGNSPRVLAWTENPERLNNKELEQVLHYRNTPQIMTRTSLDRKTEDNPALSKTLRCKNTP